MSFALNSVINRSPTIVHAKTHLSYDICRAYQYKIKISLIQLKKQTKKQTNKKKKKKKKKKKRKQKKKKKKKKEKKTKRKEICIP